MEKKKILVTSALLYVNGLPHLGHVVGCWLPGDVFTRFHKTYGNDVVYEALLEIDYYMGVSKPIITPTAVGDDKFVELFVVVDVVVRLTSPSLEFDEIEIAHKVYKDLHFGETFEKPIFEE